MALTEKTLKKMNKIYIFILSAVLTIIGESGIADMQILSDEKLSQINAGSGISIHMDTRVKITADTISFSDSDSNPASWIRLNGFSMDDGNGDGFILSTLDKEPFIADVGTLPDGRSLFQVNLTPFTSTFSLHATDLEFCEQSLGSLDINDVSLSQDSILRFSHHMDATAGIELDAGFALDMGSLTHIYNNDGNALSISGIHIAGSATGPAEDPSSWQMTDSFSIGDLNTTPASIDVGTDNTTGNTSVYLNFPISGTVRVEDISLNNQSFGPAVIDNIQAHRLTIILGP